MHSHYRLPANNLLPTAHSCFHFSPSHEISVKTHHLDDFEPHRLETKPSQHRCPLCLPDKKMPIKNSPGSPTSSAALQVFPIRIKSLSSKLCVSGFLGSLRCLWRSQAASWFHFCTSSPSQLSKAHEVHSFPYINQHPLDSILPPRNWFIKTHYRQFSKRKMYLGHKQEKQIRAE